MLKNLIFRRPSGPGADPRAGPGGEDFIGSPRPDARLDCQALRSFYETRDLPAIGACLRSLTQAQSIAFRVRRLAVPYLELILPETAPECVRNTLSKVAVPREIIFQSDEEGSLSCYSSRLAIESDEVPMISVKWPLKKTLVRIEFPLGKAPETDLDTALLLGTWAMTPFFEGPAKELSSHLLPDALCKTCMGERNLIREDDPPPQHWPISN